MRTSDEQKRDTKNVLLRAVNIALTAILALLLCFVLLKIFFITWVTVDQSSMYPTYEDGETVFINRSGDVARGEVVVFYDADVSAPRISSAFGLFAGDAKLLIKRVVAKEGDEIWLEELGGGEYALRIGCADTGETIGEEYVGPDGAPVPCETWDNAILLCEAENAAGDRFPMQMEMKRMAPGCTNTVEYEIYGLNMSACFTTDDPNAVRYTQAVGREQAWARLVVGQKTLYPVITGGIFEFGFSDSLLQMFAAYVSELRGLPCGFGCFTPAEAEMSHRLLTGALEACEQRRVVTL